MRKSASNVLSQTFSCRKGGESNKAVNDLALYPSTLDLLPLERALWALASSSEGAACPGATRGQPGGRLQELGGDFYAI